MLLESLTFCPPRTDSEPVSQGDEPDLWLTISRRRGCIGDLDAWPIITDELDLCWVLTRPIKSVAPKQHLRPGSGPWEPQSTAMHLIITAETEPANTAS